MATQATPAKRGGGGGRGGGRKGRGKGGGSRRSGAGGGSRSKQEQTEDEKGNTTTKPGEKQDSEISGDNPNKVSTSSKSTKRNSDRRRNGGGRRTNGRKPNQEQDSAKPSAEDASNANENGKQANRKAQNRKRGSKSIPQTRGGTPATASQATGQAADDESEQASAETLASVTESKENDTAAVASGRSSGSGKDKDAKEAIRSISESNLNQGVVKEGAKEDEQNEIEQPELAEAQSHQSVQADDDLEERRQAEIEFVAAAYSPEEAWCDDAKSDPLKVYRRLSLPDTNSADQFVSVVLTLAMGKGYPETKPLEVSFAVEKGPNHLWNSASDAAPILVESCRQVAEEMLGDEAIFAVFSHADEWTQDRWPDFCQLSKPRSNKQVSSRPDSKKGAFLGRRLIYSHHIIGKVKRANMKTLAAHYDLTGYVKIGWPGIIIIEGLEEHCQFFYDDIKVWNWKYLVVRGEQQEKVGFGETIDSLRRFSGFPEVSEMSVVADHCRNVGLEALFKTSMKVYDNTEEAGGAMLSDEKPYGNLIWVDHMNEGKNYRKWLRKTSLDTSVFLLIKQCYPNHDFTKKPTILVAVVGEMECVQDFMKRWRTSRVDRDSRGQACLERKMTILHEGEMQDDVMGALDWDTASDEPHLNKSKEELIDIIASFGNQELFAAAESLLSPS